MDPLASLRLGALPETPVAPQEARLLAALLGQELLATVLEASDGVVRLALPGGGEIAAGGELDFPPGTQLRVQVQPTAEGGVVLRTLEARLPAPPPLLAPLLQGEAQALLGRLGQGATPELQAYQSLVAGLTPGAGASSLLDEVLPLLVRLAALPAPEAPHSAGQGTGMPSLGQPTTPGAEGRVPTGALEGGGAPPGTAIPRPTGEVPAATPGATLTGAPVSDANTVLPVGTGPVDPGPSRPKAEQAAPSGGGVPGQPTAGSASGQAPSTPPVPVPVQPGATGAPAAPLGAGMPTAPAPALAPGDRLSVPAPIPAPEIPGAPAPFPRVEAPGVPSPAPQPSLSAPPLGKVLEDLRTRLRLPQDLGAGDVVRELETRLKAGLKAGETEDGRPGAKAPPGAAVPGQEELVAWASAWRQDVGAMASLLAGAKPLPASEAAFWKALFLGQGAPESATQAGGKPSPEGARSSVQPPADALGALHRLEQRLAAQPDLPATRRAELVQEARQALSEGRERTGPGRPEADRPAAWRQLVEGGARLLADPAVSPREAPFHALQALEHTAWFELPLPWVAREPLQLWAEWQEEGRGPGGNTGAESRVVVETSFSQLGRTRAAFRLREEGLQVRLWLEHPEAGPLDTQALVQELQEGGRPVELQVLPLPDGAPSLREYVTGPGWGALA